ncbi:MAG: phosphonate-binding protein [Alphaproteobacteria bacterium]|nr:phosphonate-binding protein [Alphaproteobacteria bacterium]
MNAPVPKGSAQPHPRPRRADEPPLKAVLGPTNTGKTHLAVERMLDHRDGMIGLPLRLLAREIYDRVVKEKGASAVALITGEEKIAPETARYFVCTVEAMPLDRHVEFLAVDEIQLARDPDRGHIFTDRILYARGQGETMLLGAETMRPMLRRLLPHAEFSRRERLSTLSYAGPRKLTKLPKRTAIVAFSAEEVYAIAELIRRHKGGAAVVMGALSPRTRNAQVALYQSGEVDFLVATDAIGMGLNMNVDHVAFASAAKFDGRRNRVLRPDEVAQIAGRAGRFQSDGEWGETGECPPFDEETIERVEAHDFEPVDAIEWRNGALDFASLKALLRTLEQPPDRPGLLRARGADDEEALKRLMLDEALIAQADAPARVRRLWEACQLPDFRKSGIEEHARLVGRVAEALLSVHGRLSEDWLAKEVKALDRIEGDLPALQQRLAHIRTWTYAANRADWIAHAEEWRARTRAIEDRLSDALHDLLTQRFIDRRTSALLRGLKREDALVIAVAADGDVVVEGHSVGKLEGLRFVPDPQAFGLEGRAVRNAALKALAPEIVQRLAAIAACDGVDLTLADDGAVEFRGAAIARLGPGAPLRPRLDLIGAEEAPQRARSAALARLKGWLDVQIARDLQPYGALAAGEGVSGAARGLAFRLLESAGALDRADANDLVDALDAQGRAALSAIGVYVGRRSIYVPRMIRPRPARLWSVLWAAAHETPAFLPRAGAVSAPIGVAPPWRSLAAAGYRAAGPVVLRLDIVERLAAALASAEPPDEAAIASLIARPAAELASVLPALGFRRSGDRWTAPAPRRKPPAPPPANAFAALAALRPPPVRRPRRRAKPAAPKP